MTATPSQSSATAVRDARAALQRGDPLAAEAICRDALAHGRDDAAIWTLLALALRPRDEVAAEAALLRALERDPRSVDAHFHLGNLRRDQAPLRGSGKRVRTSARGSRRGTRAFSTTSASRSRDRDAHARAEACYRDALRGQPDHRQAMGNLAHLLTRNRRIRGSASLLRALSAAHSPTPTPRSGSTTGSASSTICTMTRAPRRASAARFRSRPTTRRASSISVRRCWRRGDFAGAAGVLARAAGEGPLGLYASSLLALARQQLCAWDGLDALHAQVADRIARSAPDECLANPLATLSMPISPSGAAARGGGVDALLAAGAGESSGRAAARVQAAPGLRLVGFSRSRNRLPALRGLGAARSGAVRNDGVQHRPPGSLAVAGADRARVRSVPRRVRRNRPAHRAADSRRRDRRARSTSTVTRAARAARSSRCGRRPSS